MGWAMTGCATTGAIGAVGVVSNGLALTTGVVFVGTACTTDIDDCEGRVAMGGVIDDEDNCEDVANADQADLDGDGIGSACDDDEGAAPTAAHAELRKGYRAVR